MSLITQTYKPSMNVGQVYARPYGSTSAPLPIGNVLELSLEHSEDVQTQDDMTKLGGGTHAEVRRVKEVKLKMKLADLNVTNLARGELGTVEGIEAGDVADEPHIATLGGLLRLAPRGIGVCRRAGVAGADRGHDGRVLAHPPAGRGIDAALHCVGVCGVGADVVGVAKQPGRFISTTVAKRFLPPHRAIDIAVG